MVISNLLAATYAVTAVAVDNDGLTNAATVTATIYVDSGAPRVEIFSPIEDAIVTAPSPVIGTASSSILQSYLLRYRLKTVDDTGSWTTLANGSTSVLSNTMAVFDPTLLLNGIYELQLTATDLLGRTSLSEPQTLIFDRDLKIGHFTIAFDDVVIPLPGLPLQVTRTYDSRAAAAGIQGDFGIGWTMDIRNVRLQKNRPLGRNWEEYTSGSPVGLTLAYHLDPGGIGL